MPKITMLMGFPPSPAEKNKSHEEAHSNPFMLKKTLPSGKHTKNYGKAPFFMGNSTINGQFSIAMLLYQRVNQEFHKGLRMNIHQYPRLSTHAKS